MAPNVRRLGEHNIGRKRLALKVKRPELPEYPCCSMRFDTDFEPLVTERLLLRRSRPEDAEAISAYRRDPTCTGTRGGSGQTRTGSGWLASWIRLAVCMIAATRG
jgi:RimJ/RimL family protein N-acetyltransferase